ncbi:MAG: hypothetical protein BroJett018_21370 [Chloroflexota bacterium]|nr:hypothetical protein [Chloroflexota bacterium]NOG65430.1 hypothetical protein [Chloroflexota bacterium]GIK64343.1 MAG: hypothetical protein BroJett018_21370 [Chloroflexota bacterium]
MVYLQITMRIAPSNRPQAAAVYTKYKQAFLTQVLGAKSKDLLIRDEDVQVTHGFNSSDNAKAYLQSPLFNEDVVRELKPLLQDNPDIRIYESA